MGKRRHDVGNARRRKRGKPFWAPVAGRPMPSDETATIPYEQLRGYTDGPGGGRPADGVGRRDKAANELLKEDAKKHGISFRAYLKREGICAGVEEGNESWRKTEEPRPGASPEGPWENTGIDWEEEVTKGDAFDTLTTNQAIAQGSSNYGRSNETGQWRRCDLVGVYTRRVSDGQDMEGQGACLRGNGLLSGLTPQEYWDRRFQRLTARQKSAIRARERLWGRPKEHLLQSQEVEVHGERGSSGLSAKPGGKRPELGKEAARSSWIASHPLDSFTKEALFDRLAQFHGKYRPYASLPAEACTAMPAGATAPGGPLATTWIFMEQLPRVRELAKLGVAADELGLTDVEAAERLGLTQPALSKARKELRAEKDAAGLVRRVSVEGHPDD